MKNKKLIIPILLCGILHACSLDTENLTQKDSSSFPANPADMKTAMISVYSESSNVTKKMNWEHPFANAEYRSDQRFGGGGLHDINMHSMNGFKISSKDQYLDVWRSRYTAIYRANFVLSYSDKIDFESEDQKNSILGQAYFMRGYLYMDLARMFGRAPLILDCAKPAEITQPTHDELWAQIFSDLKQAADMMPSTVFSAMDKSEDGVATKWAAEGLLARAFLYYTGYFDKTSAPLLEGGTLTKDQVISYVDDCVTNSGHDLLPEFRNLWPYAIANVDYGYAADNNLNWVGEDGTNQECVWALKYNGYGDRNWSSNDVCLGMGIRRQFQVPFGKGWGFGPVNPQTWEEWPDEDIRKMGSIYSVEDETSYVSGYVYDSSQAQETGFWQKKYMPINIYDANHKATGYATVLYGAYNHFTRNNAQDIMIIRFADILLMGAELGGPNAQLYLDKVRGRVGLPSVPATLENIKKERQYELAFEGIRYYDLLRWHDEVEAFAKVQNVPIITGGTPTTLTIEYRPETKGLLPIPDTEIDLANGGIEQNAGWTSASVFW